jgi:hypothetical protein
LRLLNSGFVVGRCRRGGGGLFAVAFAGGRGLIVTFK